MKENIRKTLETLGFELEEMNDFGCKFQYEGANYLWIYCNNDDEFLTIALPGVLDLKKVDELFFYKMMDNLNSTLKYIKVNMLYGSMWFFYERELMGDEDLERLIPQMIAHLYHAQDMLNKSIEKCAEGNDSDDSAESPCEDIVEIEDTEALTDSEE